MRQRGNVRGREVHAERDDDRRVHAEYSSNYSENASMASDTKGTCTATACYSSQKTITIPASGDTSVAWADQTGGAPVAAVNPGKLVGVQWQFTIPAGMSCMANLTIDNVTFY